MARKLLLGWKNFVADNFTTFSGGDWALPLTRMQDIAPQIVAEALNNDPANTTFDVDLGAQRTVGIFHFSNLRVSVNGLIRLRAGTDPTFATTTYSTSIVTGTAPAGPIQLVGGGDILLAGGEGSLLLTEEEPITSDWIPAWPMDAEPMSYNQWGEFTLTGAYAAEEYMRLGLTRFFIPPVPVDVRYIRFEIQDTTGEVVKIGVFGAWSVWEPPYNLSRGHEISIIDESEVQTVPGGSTFIIRRGIRQRHNLGFDVVPSTEVWLRSFSIALRKGRSSPVVIVPDPDDTTNLEKRSIYGLFTTATFTNPFYAVWSQAYQIDQLI